VSGSERDIALAIIFHDLILTRRSKCRHIHST
jgi:hypothetical protein